MRGPQTDEQAIADENRERERVGAWRLAGGGEAGEQREKNVTGCSPPAVGASE